MPKAFLEQSGQKEYSENCLANFAFMSRADNRVLGGVAPSSYRMKMPADTSEILNHAICSESLFDDKFKTFIDGRAERLAYIATVLCDL